MKEFEFKNRNNLSIAGKLNIIDGSPTVAFISHGLGGFMDQMHIKTFERVFRSAKITTVLWDATNSLGRSDGKMENATITSYLSDLEDLLKWASHQTWFKEPFILCGHSLGGITSILYAEEHPEQVKALAPISTVVTGELTWKTYSARQLEHWKERGYREERSKSKPWVMKRLNWSHMEDRLKHDGLKKVLKLTMPVLLIVGSKDTSTPLETQELLFEALPEGSKEIHVIKNAPHTFYNPLHLKQISKLIKDWIVVNKLAN